MIVLNLTEAEAVSHVLRMEKYGTRTLTDHEANQVVSTAIANRRYLGSKIIVEHDHGLFNIWSRTAKSEGLPLDDSVNGGDR